ncbi:uncharacterized protein LOC9656695 [Selaginella moellendorffii]|uniref:uncharacterized protein LOC9656695 n=1 Tax=Selaginella moellendorffii TaxID=88036 RepID=UPI000D1CC690|nr:uncharacterized protein LOC9656695 [Selaginella moellendorffii]|eukprot:XP_024534826.1 uncharacterized protein LOC9656695 [Selaginella moellendorffii]
MATGVRAMATAMRGLEAAMRAMAINRLSRSSAVYPHTPRQPGIKFIRTSLYCLAVVALLIAMLSITLQEREEEEKPFRVLVIGASGFLGYKLSLGLLANTRPKIEVVGIDAERNERAQLLESAGMHILYGNVTKWALATSVRTGSTSLLLYPVSYLLQPSLSCYRFLWWSGDLVQSTESLDEPITRITNSWRISPVARKAELHLHRRCSGGYDQDDSRLHTCRWCCYRRGHRHSNASFIVQGRNSSGGQNLGEEAKLVEVEDANPPPWEVEYVPPSHLYALGKFTSFQSGMARFIDWYEQKKSMIARNEVNDHT